MDVIELNSIETYCRVFDMPMTHRLVSVVDCDDPEKLKPYMISWGFYALFLKDMASCTITYGQTHYDHGDKSIICFAPGQVCAFEAIPGKSPKFTGVLFHPDFIRGTELGRNILRYSFFQYTSNEALHLSPSEFKTITSVIEIIRNELDTATDDHTPGIVCDNIRLLLDYCARFYDRQFAERHALNKDVLQRFENLLNQYFISGEAMRKGLPTVNYFADKINLSPNYFGDLVKRLTGMSAKDYLSRKLLGMAKEQLMNPQKNITQVADSLGFQYPQHFVRFFKRMTGQTPSEFRKSKA